MSPIIRFPLYNVKWCATDILWKNVAIMSVLHLVFVWVCAGAIRGAISLYTVAYFWLLAFCSAFGILAGAHRLWSHRSYKARLPLRILLMILNTMALQNDIYDWCRNHRVHHRFSETDADPHNSRRGFFFSHMGWLLCRKHPDVKQFGSRINMDDVLADPVVRFQMRHYRLLVLFLWLILPVSVSMYFGESLFNSVLVNCWRYVISLHNTWLVNSLAHLHGTRPYNRTIEPRENKIVAYFSLGEGYHNYHHSFPWDYSASELGWRHNYNLATGFIDFFSWCGLAYDLKIPSLAMVLKRMDQSGEKQLCGEMITRRLGRAGRLVFPVIGDTLVGLATVTLPVTLLVGCKFVYCSRWH